MHIYHFAPYEPATLKRLMTKHNTHIQEVDQLLRGERFIDLYQVLRHAIRASVESYSLKEMERFYGFERKRHYRKPDKHCGLCNPAWRSAMPPWMKPLAIRWSATTKKIVIPHYTCIVGWRHCGMS